MRRWCTSASRSCAPTARRREARGGGTRLPPASQVQPARPALLGRDRLRQGDLFKGCPGVLAIQVLPDAQAQGLQQPGDILLRYQGECLGEPKDLIKAVARVPATQEVPLVYVRAGTSATARVRGGKLGVALTAF